MYICYFDESGDDGYPNYSSQLFVLSCLYMHQSSWKNNYEEIHEYRKRLKDRFGLPVKREFHTMHFLTDKGPYHGKYSPEIRKELLENMCDFFAVQDVKAINVVIDKNKIKNESYDVLEKALTYNIQRVENDMTFSEQDDKDFIIITDEGRVASMRQVTRKIQRINFIPSKYHQGSYRKEIEHLIEDPLPKPSEESWFIQFADLLATVVMLYARRNLVSEPIRWANRLQRVLNYGDEIELMERLRPSLNLKASNQNKFGIVKYPT